MRLSSSALYLSPVDDVHIKILEYLVVCERVVVGRAAMQCDCLVMVGAWGAYTFIGCKLHCCIAIDFAHTPS